MDMAMAMGGTGGEARRRDPHPAEVSKVSIHVIAKVGSVSQHVRYCHVKTNLRSMHLTEYELRPD